MVRPKSSVERERVNLTLDKKIMNMLREYSETTGIAYNRIIEQAVKEWMAKNPIEELPLFKNREG